MTSTPSVSVATDAGDMPAHLWLPPAGTGPGVLLLQEIFGINAHIRSVADTYARHGYTAIAPAFFDHVESGVELGYDEPGYQQGFKLAGEVGLDRALEDVASAAESISSSGKIGVVGFCLGGLLAYLASTRLPIDAAVSYYGVKIDPHLGEADRLRCPLLMHFAENDPHVPSATVAAIQARLGGLGNVSIHVYPGTGHGFNRQGYPPYDEAAAAQARQRTLAHFRRYLA